MNDLLLKTWIESELWLAEAKELLRKHLKNLETGQGMVEYALVVAIVSVVAIAALKTIGTNVNTMLTWVGSQTTPNPNTP